jgi:glycine cleavage system regulatory protein
MNISLTLTILGQDKLGLVNCLAKIIFAHKANWLESKMSRLAGQFTRILRVEREKVNIKQLTEDLKALETEGLQISFITEEKVSLLEKCLIHVDVIANDRLRIMQELSKAITNAGGNIEELTTELQSAAMSGYPIFHAYGKVSLIPSATEASLCAAIELLSDDLSVEIH